MSRHAFINVLILAGIAWMTVLVVKTRHSGDSDNLRTRISAYRVAHHSKAEWIKSLHRDLMRYTYSENPRIVSSIREIERLLLFKSKADSLIQSMIRHRNESDSVTYYFNQYKSSIQGYHPTYDSLCSRMEILDQRNIEDILILKKLFENDKSLKQGGDVAYLGILNLRSDLYAFTINVFSKLAIPVDASSIRYPNVQTAYRQPLIQTDYPVVMYAGQTERFAIWVSGEILARKDLEKTKHLVTNEVLNLILLNTDAFEIKPLQPEEHYIPFTGHGVWEFDITPRKKGKHQIIFRSGQAKISLPAEEVEYSVPVHHAEIEVK